MASPIALVLVALALFIVFFDFALKNTDEVVLRFFWGSEARSPMILLLLAGAANAADAPATAAPPAGAPATSPAPAPAGGVYCGHHPVPIPKNTRLYLGIPDRTYT